ncbi:helix-turn-helix domain-containing protein [Paenibacillus solani]|uniref:helix-turn-helix domain-containing protein n=1 Tax=Paenibacillus solani TaxID=1705565 RepID=UPI003D2BE98F
MANHNDKSIEFYPSAELFEIFVKKKKLTQDELSLYSRVNRSYISELENGEKAPTLLTITALARALHVKASVLIEGYEKELED